MNLVQLGRAATRDTAKSQRKPADDHEAQGSHNREQHDARPETRGRYSRGQDIRSADQDRYSLGASYYDEPGYSRYPPNDGYGSFRSSQPQFPPRGAYSGGPAFGQRPHEDRYGGSSNRYPPNDSGIPRSAPRGRADRRTTSNMCDTRGRSSRRSASPQDRRRTSRERLESRQHMPKSQRSKPDPTLNRLAKAVDIDPQENAAAFLMQKKQRAKQAQIEAQADEQAQTQTSTIQGDVDMANSGPVDSSNLIGTLQGSTSKHQEQTARLDNDLSTARQTGSQPDAQVVALQRLHNAWRYLTKCA